MTTSRLDALRALLPKLRAATGPDRKLDGELCGALLGWEFIGLSGWIDNRGMSMVSLMSLTGSLDGALRLVPPGWVSSAQEVMPGNRWRWSLTRWSDGMVVEPAMPSATAPLALLLAVVEARILEEEGHG